MISNPIEVENEHFIQEWYTNEEFMEDLYESLSDDGVIVFQLGRMSTRTDGLPESETMEWKIQLVSLLQTLGFERTHIYSEFHNAFSGKIEISQVSP